MRNFLSLLIPAVLVFLSACATTAGYEEILDSWLGSQEIDLVRSWGPPDRSYEVDGRKFIVYSFHSNIYVPGTPPTYQTDIVGNRAYTYAIGGSAPMNISRSCETSFEIDSGKIVSWSHRGDGCKG